MSAILAPLGSILRSRYTRAAAICVGVLAVVMFLYWGNFSTIEVSRRSVHGTNVSTSHLLASLATASALGVLSILWYGEGVRQSQPRGLTAKQFCGFAMTGLILFALVLAFIVGPSLHPEMIW
jgi:hypothetical protein